MERIEQTGLEVQLSRTEDDEGTDRLAEQGAWGFAELWTSAAHAALKRQLIRIDRIFTGPAPTRF